MTINQPLLINPKVHGRSREQRYTKVADWEYIKTCAAAAQPVPLFGNGDMLSFEDYNHQLSTSGVDGIMIARYILITLPIPSQQRQTVYGIIIISTQCIMLLGFDDRGALIKPWIFKEIKEQRHWDISSSERLDILRCYVNYGLEHWGSDSQVCDSHQKFNSRTILLLIQGVENTRRFLLEWLSFLYRYDIITRSA